MAKCKKRLAMTKRRGRNIVTREDIRDVLTSTGINIYGVEPVAKKKEMRQLTTEVPVNAPALRAYARTKPRHSSRPRISFHGRGA